MNLENPTGTNVAGPKLSKERVEKLFPPGWYREFGDEFNTEYMNQIFVYLRQKSEYLPQKYDIFRAFQATDFDDVKVVILGVEPYHMPGYANGLAFGVNDNIAQKPKALINIFKEVEMCIGSRIDRTQSALTAWASQGVLLLNSTLTVESRKPFSHQHLGWQNLTDAAILALGVREKPLVFMLWGDQARSKRFLIEPHHLVLEADQPHSTYVNIEKAPFAGCRHFLKANQWLAAQDQELVDWSKTW